MLLLPVFCCKLPRVLAEASRAYATNARSISSAEEDFAFGVSDGPDWDWCPIFTIAWRAGGNLKNSGFNLSECCTSLLQQSAKLESVRKRQLQPVRAILSWPTLES